MNFTWSDYQNNIFDFVKNGTGNAVVEAVAGAAKTTTLLESYKRLPSNKKSIFLAFNKAIAEEMKKKDVNARTFHSLCFFPVTKHVGTNSVDTNKNRNIVRYMFEGNKRSFEIYEAPIKRLLPILKSSGVGISLPDDECVYDMIMETFSIDLDYSDIDDIESKIYTRESLIKKTKQAFKMSIDEKYTYGIDFDDLLYIAVKKNLNIGKFDFVFVDEAQDTAPIQREILRKIMKSDSRLVAVGDPYQSIYGFRGSNSESMNLIKDEFNCISLPLHISYRCPKNVVAEAQNYCSIIQCSDTAIEGNVQNLKKDWNIRIFQDGDFILSRTNAPLISLCYKLIINKIPAKVLGREIGENLINLIERLSKNDDLELFILDERLDNWCKKELKRIDKASTSQKSSIEDRYLCIKSLIKNMNPIDKVENLINTLRNMFDNSNATITLSSIHKAKGLEAERVFWLNKDKIIKTNQEWETLQERNMKYVAITRSKKDLFYIESLVEEQKAITVLLESIA